MALCAAYGDVKTMRYLIEDLKLDINQAGGAGLSLIHRATMNANHGIQIAKFMKEKYGNLKVQDDSFLELA